MISSNVKFKRAAVIAHFHPRGEIREDFLALVNTLSQLVDTVVLVSTNLSEIARKSLAGSIEVITRPNIGYDFSYYRVGIEQLDDVEELDELVILNSSFLCLDPQKLINRFFSCSRENVDILGLTRSNEMQFHLQSFFMAFQKTVLLSRTFADWWRSVTPINDRASVILNYELGLSQYFLKHGFKLKSAYTPGPEMKKTAIQRAYVRYRYEGDAESLNPTHFYWDSLLSEYGIVKIELIKKNPHSLDLDSLKRDYYADERYRKMIDQAIAS